MHSVHSCFWPISPERKRKGRFVVLKVVALGRSALASLTVLAAVAVVVVLDDVELAAPVFGTFEEVTACLLRRREIALLVASEMCMYRLLRAT